MQPTPHLSRLQPRAGQHRRVGAGRQRQQTPRVAQRLYGVQQPQVSEIVHLPVWAREAGMTKRTVWHAGGWGLASDKAPSQTGGRACRRRGSRQQAPPPILAAVPPPLPCQTGRRGAGVTLSPALCAPAPQQCGPCEASQRVPVGAASAADGGSTTLGAWERGAPGVTRARTAHGGRQGVANACDRAAPLLAPPHAVLTRRQQAAGTMAATGTGDSRQAGAPPPPHTHTQGGRLTEVRKDSSPIARPCASSQIITADAYDKPPGGEASLWVVGSEQLVASRPQGGNAPLP